MTVQKVQATSLPGHLIVWSSFTYSQTTLFQAWIAQAWGCKSFLKFDVAGSKWPKFKIWHTFFKKYVWLHNVYIILNLVYFLAFWVVPDWASNLKHFGLSFSHFLSESKQPHIKLKRRGRPFIWAQKLSNWIRNQPITGSVWFIIAHASYLHFKFMISTETQF